MGNRHSRPVLPSRCGTNGIGYRGPDGNGAGEGVVRTSLGSAWCRGGIGRACVRIFAERGRHVFAADRDPAVLRTAATSIAGGVTALQVDATRPKEVEALFRTASQAGTLRDLVYAPGVVVTAAIDRTDWSEYRRLMTVNLDGAFYACSALFRNLPPEADTGRSF